MCARLDFRLDQIFNGIFCASLQAGMDMAIVNAGALPIYDDIEPELRQLCEVRTSRA